jgi:cytochrome c
MRSPLAATLCFAAAFCALTGFALFGTQDKPQAKEAVDNGIGPVKEVKLGKLDDDMVQEGNGLFYSKCFLCHDVDQTKLAPPLRGVAKQRTPVFIMNYLLNTVEMQQKDPAVKALVEKFANVPKMPDQQLTKAQARAVLEFLRTVSE